MAQAGRPVGGAPFEVVIAGKAYDKKALVGGAEARGGEAAIPALSARKGRRETDEERRKGRNLAGRFWHKVKQPRRVAARYEKTARNSLAFARVASVMILLR